MECLLIILFAQAWKTCQTMGEVVPKSSSVINREQARQMIEHQIESKYHYLITDTEIDKVIELKGKFTAAVDTSWDWNPDYEYQGDPGHQGSWPGDPNAYIFREVLYIFE